MDSSFRWWVWIWPKKKKNEKLFVIGSDRISFPSYLSLTLFVYVFVRAECKNIIMGIILFGSENNWWLLIQYNIALSSQLFNCRWKSVKKEGCLLIFINHWSIYVTHTKIEHREKRKEKTNKNVFDHCASKKLHVQIFLSD